MNTNLKWHLVSFPSRRTTLTLGLSYPSSASGGRSCGSNAHTVSHLYTVAVFLDVKRLPLVMELLALGLCGAFHSSPRGGPGPDLVGHRQIQLWEASRGSRGK